MSDDEKRDDSYDVVHTVNASGGYPLHLTKSGKWLTGDELREATTPKEEN